MKKWNASSNAYDRPDRPTKECKSCGGKDWFLRLHSDTYACSFCNSITYRTCKVVDEHEVEG